MVLEKFGLLQHFELSFEAGIGGHVFRLGRILRRSGEEVRHDPLAQKEFELLGAHVAVPILDRETVLGVALFDGRITGEPLVNSELELIFHLLEQLGLAIKNIWLHSQLAVNHEMMADILRELSSAPDLWVQKGYLCRAVSRAGEGWRDEGVMPLAHYLDCVGGPADATIMGLGRKTSITNAALVNGVFGSLALGLFADKSVTARIGTDLTCWSATRKPFVPSVAKAFTLPGWLRPGTAAPMAACR